MTKQTKTDSSKSSRGLISVVFPTLNESVHIATTLDSLVRKKGACELIVVDGGSDDGTPDVVSNYEGVKIIKAPRCRATQMNAGARIAKGDILLFMHADTLLPPGALVAIHDAMQDPKVVGGSFYLGFDTPDPILRFYSLMSRINHRLFTYGDQAMFVRKKVFDRLDGYKNIPIMEDLEIQTRIRSSGRFVKIQRPVRSSARRFHRVGLIKQQLLNIALVSLYLIGAPPARLKRLYSDAHRSRSHMGTTSKGAW